MDQSIVRRALTVLVIAISVVLCIYPYNNDPPAKEQPIHKPLETVGKARTLMSKSFTIQKGKNKVKEIEIQYSVTDAPLITDEMLETIANQAADMIRSEGPVKVKIHHISPPQK